jgi:hypothetical protein
MLHEPSHHHHLDRIVLALIVAVHVAAIAAALSLVFSAGGVPAGPLPMPAAGF